MLDRNFPRSSGGIHFAANGKTDGQVGPYKYTHKENEKLILAKKN